jgi:outer membrane protein assembly factor BamD
MTMRTAKQVIFSLILFSFMLLAACSTTSDPADSYPGQTGQQIFQGGEDSLRDHNYAEAIKRFEALDAQYPFDPNTQTAQLHIIYAYYMNGDYPSAEAAADRFIHLHPTSPHNDYAYYMRGLSNYYQNMGVFERLFAVDFATRDLTQIKKSYNDYATLERNYPNSAYAPAAHQYMIYLRDVLANHQMEVGQYYFSRRAYVASANRASLVVEHYEGAPVVPDALVMMAKSYYQLHLGDQLNQTIEVLQYNYPNSRYTQEVSGRELGNTKFKIVTNNNIYVPPKQVVQAPPSVVVMHATPAAGTATHVTSAQASVPMPAAQMPVQTAQVSSPAPAPGNITYSANHTNGEERATTTAVGKLVNTFKSWKKTVTPSSPVQASTVSAQALTQTASAKPSSAPQPVVQQGDVQKQVEEEQLQENQEAAPQHAQAAPASVKSADGSKMVTLGGMWDKVKNSELFALHSKTDKTAATQQVQVANSSNSLAAPEAEPAPEAAAAPETRSVTPENGARA